MRKITAKRKKRTHLHKSKRARHHLPPWLPPWILARTKSSHLLRPWIIAPSCIVDWSSSLFSHDEPDGVPLPGEEAFSKAPTTSIQRETTTRLGWSQSSTCCASNRDWCRKRWRGRGKVSFMVCSVVCWLPMGTWYLPLCLLRCNCVCVWEGGWLRRDLGGLCVPINWLLDYF